MPPWQQQSMLHHLPSSTSAGVAGLPMLAGLRRAEQRSLVRLLSSSAAAAVARPASSSPQARTRWPAAATTSPMHPGALIARRLHTEQQQQQHSSSEGMPPPSSTSGKASSSSPSPPVYQSARPTPSSSSTSSPPATSDITRVTPVSLTPGGERGAAHNQESVALSQLAEKQAIEKAKQEAEEKRLREMGVVKRVWEKVKEEAQHYWHGTKLLGKEIRISSRLLRRLLLGYSLTRREHRQLKRTFADLLRLIPFAPFIIVPFGELLLPVAIKIFPNMLPSTFESKFAVETKRRGLIKVRLEMAKFLQGTIREGGIQATEQVKTSDEFKEFFRKVRATGEQPSDSDIVKVAKLFDDDLTLDNLTRPQLVSMCRYMQINAFGTDNYLRYQIRTKLGRIRRDDIVIQHEGLDKLTQHELQSACGSRGIQTLNLGEDRLRDELRQWIELHITQRISGTLLILSKAFNYVPSGEENAASQMKSLELTLSSLPDNLINEAELNVSKDSATNKQRLEVLQQQEELIEDEAEQEAAEEEARRVERQRKKEVEEARLAREEEDARVLLPKGEVSAGEKATKPKQQEGPAAEGEKKAEKSAESEELRMTNEQLTELGEALSLLSAKSSVEKEREELAALIKEVSATPGEEEPQQVSAETASQVAAEDGKQQQQQQQQQQQASSPEDGEAQQQPVNQSAVSRSLAKRVRGMLEKIDSQLLAYEEEVGSKMHIIEASASGKISVEDVEAALRLIKHRPDEEVLERLVDSMDKDKDGLIPLQEVVALAKQESGLGIVREDSIRDIAGQGRKLGKEMRGERREGGGGEASKEVESTKSEEGKKGEDGEKKLRREDIVKEE